MFAYQRIEELVSQFAGTDDSIDKCSEIWYQFFDLKNIGWLKFDTNDDMAILCNSICFTDKWYNVSGKTTVHFSYKHGRSNA